LGGSLFRNSGDISWHKNRIFISEVFRSEELAFELVTPEFYGVFFRTMEIGELNVETSPAMISVPTARQFM
jgi:hypothetical protein